MKNAQTLTNGSISPLPAEVPAPRPVIAAQAAIQAPGPSFP